MGGSGGVDFRVDEKDKEIIGFVTKEVEFLNAFWNSLQGSSDRWLRQQAVPKVVHKMSERQTQMMNWTRI
jgi:hypothetical protein